LILLNHGRGLTNRQIAQEINRHPRTVQRWLTKFHETGLMEKKKNPGRPRKTNFDDDVYIGLVAMENPRVTRREIREELGLFNVSLDTISKRLNESGLYARVARIKESLSVGHRAARLHFANQFLNFDQWDRTIFVDESTFQTGHAVRNIVWRPIGTAYDEKYIIPKAQSGRRSVSVFGLMSSRGLGPLIRINGRFDSEAYIDILDNTVIPYIEEEFLYEDIYYYQDNSPIHRSRIVTNWFEDNFAPGQLIRTPAKSFDINPIENVWGRHKVRVANDGLYQTEGEL
jgi:transposase